MGQRVGLLVDERNPMRSPAAAENINVSLCVIKDIIDHFPIPACLINCSKIAYANELYIESMAALDFRAITDGTDSVGSKELVINNAIFIAQRIYINAEYLLVTLMERKGIRLSIDPLTGLFNRDCFASLFKSMLEGSKSKKEIMSILFVDLDGFKKINDTYGHEKGDVVLKAVAERLPKIVRNHDLCFRLGGDEFVVLLRDVKDRLHPCLVARRLIHSVSQDIMLDESTAARVGASVGIASFPHDGSDMEELLKNADDAMYRAKKLGKNNYQLFGQ